MRHYVYKITNKLNNKFYIGIKSSNLDFLDTNYYGSGNLIIAAVKKYGKENFLREVLFEAKTRNEALVKECELVNSALIIDKKCYNISLGGRGTFLTGYGSVPIKSMDMTGKVTYYSSITEAATKNKYSISGIKSCLSGRSIRYKSLYWALTSNNFLIREKQKRYKSCFSISEKGEKKHYSSITEAHKDTGICRKKIQDCIALRRKSAGSLNWFAGTSEQTRFIGSGCTKSYKSIDDNGNEKIYKSLKEAAEFCNLSPSSIIQSVKRSGKSGNLRWEKING